MNQQAICSVVFNAQIIKDHLDLAQGVDSDLGLESSTSSFPFMSAEWAPITWHLHIATVACGAYFLGDDKEWLIQEFIRKLQQQDEAVRIGDYVNANPDISNMREVLGIRGWLLPIVNRRVPLRVISGAVIGFKLDLFTSVFEKIAREGSAIEWRNYKDIADIYAIAILGSYWGRVPDEHRDQSALEPISEIIYENIYAIKELIKK